jgi:hypothetical protein
MPQKEIDHDRTHTDDCGLIGPAMAGCFSEGRPDTSEVGTS